MWKCAVLVYVNRWSSEDEYPWFQNPKVESSTGNPGASVVPKIKLFPPSKPNETMVVHKPDIKLNQAYSDPTDEL